MKRVTIFVSQYNGKEFKKLQKIKIMTTLNAIKLAAQIQIGSRIQGGKQVMIVTEITPKCIKGYSEYAFLKYNTKSEMCLSYENFLNPHYSNNYKILD